MRIGCTIFLFIVCHVLIERSVGEEVLHCGKALLIGSGEYEGTSGIQSPSERIIVTYDQQAIDGLYEILSDAKNVSLWKGAFFAIGVIGSVDQTAVDTERLLIVVRNLEEMVKSEQNGTGNMSHLMSYLELGYLAVGRQSHHVWKPFFNDRLYESFWGKELPRLELYYSDGKQRISNVYDSVIFGAMTLGEQEALEWAQQLLQSNSYLKSSPTTRDRIHSYVGIGVDYKVMNINRSLHQRNLKAYEKRFAVLDETSSSPPGVEVVPSIKVSPNADQQSPAVVDDSQKSQHDRNSNAWYIGIAICSAFVALLILRRRVL